MSSDATVWAKAQRCRSQRAKLVLVLLAPYADAEGIAWAAKHILAVEGGVDERTIQRGLAELKDRAGQGDGLIELTGEFKVFKGKRYPYYRLRMERGPQNTRERLREDAELAQTTVSPQGRSRGDSPVQTRGDKGGSAWGDRAVRSHNKTPTEPKNNLPNPGAGARERMVAAWQAMPAASRAGVSSPDLFAAAWDAQVDTGADEAEMEAGCRAYARTKTAWGVSGKPCSAHRFIAEGRWKELAGSAPAAGLGESEAVPTAFAGPETVWADFTELKGENWCGSYLLPCAWDGERQALLARTNTAASRIGEEQALLRKHGIRIIAPGSAQSMEHH